MVGSRVLGGFLKTEDSVVPKKVGFALVGVALGLPGDTVGPGVVGFLVTEDSVVPA